MPPPALRHRGGGEPGGQGRRQDGASRPRARAFDRLTSVMRPEFRVEMAQVRLHCVDRQIDLGGDLRGREVGRQVAQDAHLAFAEGLAEAVRFAKRERRRASGDQVQDLGDQGAVGGAAPAVALEELGRRVHQELQAEASGFGQVERAFECALRRAVIPERMTGDGLDEERLDHQDTQFQHRGGAVEDRRKGDGRRFRVASGKAQRCQGDAHLSGCELLLVHLGEGLFDALGCAKPDQGRQQEGRICVVHICVEAVSSASVGNLVQMLIGRAGDVDTTGITTAVVLVVAALSPQHVWEQPILCLVDTAVGVAVGLAAGWIAHRLAHLYSPWSPGRQR